MAANNAKIAVFLALSDRFLAVKTDPKVAMVEKVLPGLNCGACGNVCRIDHTLPLCTAGECTWEECVDGFYDIDEKPENEMPITDEPVILLTPSLSPEAAQSLPKNVIVVLAADMIPNSHPELRLNARGIKLIRPEGDLSMLMRNKKVREENPGAFVVANGQKIETLSI